SSIFAYYLLFKIRVWICAVWKIIAVPMVEVFDNSTFELMYRSRPYNRVVSNGNTRCFDLNRRYIIGKTYISPGRFYRRAVFTCQVSTIKLGSPQMLSVFICSKQLYIPFQYRYQSAGNCNSTFIIQKGT